MKEIPFFDMSSKEKNPTTLSQKLSASGVFAPIQAHMAALDRFLEEQVAEFSPVTQEMVRYTFTHRGKRLRPALVFFAGWQDGQISEALIRAAAIVELVHLATLVHDDILDDAKLRHASPTLFAKYGSHTAVLLGDAILAHAMKLMSDFDSTELCQAMAIATRKVCDGEIWQTAERGNSNISIENYFKIIQMKTGELFEISAYLGAMLGGFGVEKAAACACFGGSLGRAYQIFDDIVDLLGSEFSIGKTLGTDLESGKYTLPVILFLKKLPENEKADSLRLITEKSIDIPQFIDRIKKSGAFDEARGYFEQEIKKARESLNHYIDNAGIQQLLLLLNFVEAQISKFFPQ